MCVPLRGKSGRAGCLSSVRSDAHSSKPNTTYVRRSSAGASRLLLLLHLGQHLLFGLGLLAQPLLLLPRDFSAVRLRLRIIRLVLRFQFFVRRCTRGRRESGGRLRSRSISSPPPIISRMS